MKKGNRIDLGNGLFMKQNTRDGGRILIGILFYQYGGEVPGVIHAQRTVSPPESIEQAWSWVKDRLLKDYRQNYGEKMEPPPDGAVFTGAWLKFCELYPTEGKRKLLLNIEGWADSTYDSTLSYFLLQILPKLNQCGSHCTQDDIRTLQQKLVKQAVDSKHSLGIRDQARKNLRNKINRCHRIYENLRDHLPLGWLPELHLRMEGKAVADVEQCKSLSPETRVSFEAMLRSLVKTPWGGIAMSLAFMHRCGLRTAESAALRFEDMKESGGVVTFWVRRQLRGDTTTDLLKTSNSYRRLPVPRLLRDMLADRKAYLQDKEDAEGSGKSVDHFPISGHYTDPEQFVPCDDISAVGRRLLQICGCKEEFWDGSRELMRLEPDVEDGIQIGTDLTAYVLRRDFASRAANVCGVTDQELNFALGHKVKNGERAKREFFGDDSMAAFGKKLERFVFDPHHSDHPAFAPIPLVPGSSSVQFIDGRLTFYATEDMEVDVTAETLDAGQSVRICTSDKTEPTVYSYSVSDLPAERDARPLLGDLPDRKWYAEQIAAAANETNLHQLKQMLKEALPDGKNV